MKLDKLDKIMKKLGFDIIQVPIDTGDKKMTRYVINRVPYSTAISKWLLIIILNNIDKERSKR